MKRFTATEKWEDRWFSGLPLKYKVLWQYLCDRCDAAGVWEPNEGLAGFQTGIRGLNWEEVRQVFAEKVRVLKNGRWWIPGFVVFQYGEELKPTANVHQSCINLLKKHGLWDDYLQWLDMRAKAKAQQGDCDTMAIPLSWDKVKVEVKAKVEVNPSLPLSDQPAPFVIRVIDIYAAYPRKEAPRDAHKAIQRAIDHIRSEQRPGLEIPVEHWLLERVKAYAAAVALWPKEDRIYIPHPSTWFNKGRYDDDPATWKREGSGKGRASFA